MCPYPRASPRRPGPPHVPSTRPLPPADPQEKPEDVPTGEMPRTVALVVDRHLVGRVTPGTRVNVVGIYSTYKVGGPGGGSSRTVTARLRGWGLEVGRRKWGQHWSLTSTASSQQV